MKPKFRIGDRVKSRDDFEWAVLGTDSAIPPARVYVGSDSPHGFIAPHTPWYLEDDLELVGCGIPAPVLRWRYVVNDIYSDMFGFRFTIRKRDGAYIAWFQSWENENPYETLGDAKAACQAYWQQLWDKEMLVSRDLPETGE